MSLMTDDKGTASAIADTPAKGRAYTLSENSPLPLVLEPTADGIDLAE